MSIPKYSKIENERRWLMPLSVINSLTQEAYKEINDLYFTCGRLRLRAITDSQTGKLEFKLCKKYGSISETAEPIVNIYLTIEEHKALSILKGNKLLKRRYKKEMKGIQHSIDVFQDQLSGLIICEVESDSENLLTKIPRPDNAIKEVTGDSIYTGGHLCRLSQAEINKLLNE